MTFLTLDLETTSETHHKRKGNPFFNRILCSGLKYSKAPAIVNTKDYLSKGTYSGVKVLVGHNIKYDLLYDWRNPELQEFFRRGGRIWDTSVVEYTLSGQQSQYPKLTTIEVENYGFAPRPKNLEAYRDTEGFLDTTKVPINLLEEDVRNDVTRTETIALKQVQACQNQGMMALARVVNDSVLATTEMEFNGVYINKEILERNQKELEVEIQLCLKGIQQLVEPLWKAEDRVTCLPPFNPGSTQHVSKLLFGGSFLVKVDTDQIDEDGHPVYIKSGVNKGKVKQRKVEVELKLTGLGLTPKNEWASKKEGLFSTDEKTLSTLVSTVKDSSASKIIIYLLRLRDLEKQNNTYYSGMKELIHDFDSCIHHTINHTSTVTGRTSSNKPNLQNIPRAGTSNIKQMFTSRYGDDGVILEVDASQLEVVIFAYLCQDQQLLEDILTGVDIHRAVGGQLFGKKPEEVTKEERQNIKPCTFHVIYGGGAARLAIEKGLPLDFCKKFIATFYERYPIAKEWQDSLVKEVEGSATWLDEYIDVQTKDGWLRCQLQQGFYISPTGRKFIFKTEEAPDFLKERGVLTSFSPSKIKNYKVQSVATADALPLCLGMLFRKSLDHRDKYLMINTVHDSIIFDVRKNSFDWACKYILDVLESINVEMQNVFQINLGLPIKFEYKYGSSWYDC